jgi:hypothetical protein
MPTSSSPPRSCRRHGALRAAVLVLVVVALWAWLAGPDRARSDEVRRRTGDTSLIAAQARGARAIPTTAAGPTAAGGRAVLVAVTPSPLTLPAALSILLTATAWVGLGRHHARGPVALRAPPRLHTAV